MGRHEEAIGFGYSGETAQWPDLLFAAPEIDESKVDAARDIPTDPTMAGLSRREGALRGNENDEMAAMTDEEIIRRLAGCASLSGCYDPSSACSFASSMTTSSTPESSTERERAQRSLVFNAAFDFLADHCNV